MKNIYEPGQISLDLRKRMELSYVLYTLRLIDFIHPPQSEEKTHIKTHNMLIKRIY